MKFDVFQTEDGGDKSYAQDRNTIKQLIVGLMLKSPDQIQKQVNKSFLSTVETPAFKNRCT